jgi:hypothetical protein
MIPNHGLAPVTLMLILHCACTPDPFDPADGPWQGNITTEGNVTTVVNESGSVWDGMARLVEEASIGVDVGADEYMFGRVAGVWVTDDRVLVLDAQIPAVRIFDHEGRHLFDVGRQGEGPGEFMNPGGMVVTSTGDILVVEPNLQVEVFGPEGEPKATWNPPAAFDVMGIDMLTLGIDDRVWAFWIDLQTRRSGRVGVGPEGIIGDPTFPPDSGYAPLCLTYNRGGREREVCNIPFQPSSLSTLTPEGDWVAGVSDTYSFDVLSPGGSELSIQRYWTPVAVPAREAAYRKQSTAEMVRNRFANDPSWTWNGPEIPDHKPAYGRFIAGRDGRIWVLREKPSRQSTDCFDDVEVCWLPEGYWLDAFGDDGRFLGTVSLDHYPDNAFIDGETIAMAVTDDAGTIMVKRYRLVLPGEDEE